MTGERLRSGSVSTIELRAAMIIGEGSAGWTMVKDLSARLPAMILPRWLRNVSHPVAIDDVVWALVASLSYPGAESRVLEVPGPERISHRDLLRKVGRAMGRTRPMINVPVLTPKLSSYWIALVTRVELDLAKELVEGVRYDLEPTEQVIWELVDHQPLALEAAAGLALRDEQAVFTPSRAATARMKAIGAELGGREPWLA
jgi:uncharacterized protein YbjT (DUF2867 family)